MLYLPKGRKNYMSGWLGPDKKWVRVSLQTPSKKRATEFAGMLARLAEDHQWDTLALLQSGSIQYDHAFAAWRNGNLALLRREAEAVDLAPLVAEWADVRLKQGVSIAAEYQRHVRRMVPEGKVFPVAKLTAPFCQSWLDGLPYSAATRLKAAASLASFCSYLKTRGIIEADVSKLLERPTQPKPRDLHLDTEQVLRLLDLSDEPFRTAFACAYGTGIEASVLIGLTRRDVMVERKAIRARGTKNHNRDRVVRVANWAWPYIEARIKSLLPDALLFPNMNRHWLSKQHNRAVERLGLEGYRLHDARHYWAVRAVRAGVPFKVVADQLGHGSTQMVAKVYGVYAPTGAERDHWEEVASAAEERLGQVG